MDIEKTIDYLINNPQQAKALLCSSLKEFIKIFHYLTTNKEFQVKDFHKDLIKKLEDIVFVKQKNLIIEMPPRAGKSEIINYFICWAYGINPFCNNIVTCYSDDLVNKFSKKMRNIIETELYQKVFRLKLAQDTKSVGLWKIKDGGETRAISINGSITGFGAGEKGKNFGGILVIDDPLKATDAKSETMREKVIEAFNGSLKSRLNNLEETPIIVIMQRLHLWDLAGYLEEEIKQGRLDKNKWDILKVKALREDGTSFWEESYSAKSLEELKLQHPYTFNSQYQQEPISESRNFFDLKMFEETTVPDTYDYSYITADTTYKDGQDNDYTVFAAFGVKDKKLYLFDVIRKKVKAVDAENMAISFIRKNSSYGFRGAYIEPKGHGIFLNQQLPKYNIVMPRETEVEEFYKDRKFDKVQRTDAIMPFFTNNKVYINKQLNTQTKSEIINECIAFPDGLHDDFVDCLTDGCKKYMKEEMYKRNAWAI